MTLMVFCRFLDKIWLQKTVCQTNIGKKIFFFLFFNQIFTFLIIKDFFKDNLCIFLKYKINKWLKKHFHEFDTKIIKRFAEKRFSVFKIPNIAPSNTLKLSLAKYFVIFFCCNHNKLFCIYSQIFFYTLSKKSLPKM